MSKIVVFLCWFFGFRLVVAAIVSLSNSISPLMSVGLMLSAALVSFTVNVIFRFLESRWQQVINLIMEALLVSMAIVAVVDSEQVMDIDDKVLVGTIVTGVVLGVQVIVFLISISEMIFNLVMTIRGCLKKRKEKQVADETKIETEVNNEGDNKSYVEKTHS